MSARKVMAQYERDVTEAMQSFVGAPNDAATRALMQAMICGIIVVGYGLHPDTARRIARESVRFTMERR